VILYSAKVVGAAETAAEREATIKDTEAKVNLTMLAVRDVEERGKR
jgi:hypothetical protein